MLLASDGTPLALVGAAGRYGVPINIGSDTYTINALNDALIWTGQVHIVGGGTKTLDTSGSSKISWRTGGTITFANGSTVLKVGIAPVDTTNGPVVRASHASNVISFDVNAAYTGGGGGVTANTWMDSVPTAGTKTISHGDFVAIALQLSSFGGADSVQIQGQGCPQFSGAPTTTQYDVGSYSNQNAVPNAIITFSDGTLGWLEGSMVYTTSNNTQTWNNTSGTKEYGNLIQLPYSGYAYGVVFAGSVNADMDVVLYSDPLGTPASIGSISIDGNTISVQSSSTVFWKYFSSPVAISANTPYGLAFKPTTGSNVQANYITLGSSAHQVVYGPNGYAINRNTGAFSAQNSSKDRFSLGLLVAQSAAGSGASAGVIG